MSAELDALEREHSGTVAQLEAERDYPTAFGAYRLSRSRLSFGEWLDSEHGGHYPWPPERRPVVIRQDLGGCSSAGCAIGPESYYSAPESER